MNNSGTTGVMRAEMDAKRSAKAGAVAPCTAVADRRRCERHATDAGPALVRQIRRGTRAGFARVLARCSSAELQDLRAGRAVLQRALQPA